MVAAGGNILRALGFAIAVADSDLDDDDEEDEEWITVPEDSPDGTPHAGRGPGC